MRRCRLEWSDKCWGGVERAAIGGLWNRKLQQDANELPKHLRHRNLELPSAEFLCAHATALREQAIVVADILFPMRSWTRSRTSEAGPVSNPLCCPSVRGWK